jgi:small subunit ribosomal protein S24e
MSIEVVNEHKNPLLGRRDAKIMVHHEGSGTPDRLAVRKIASDHFKAPQEKVYVRNVQTRTGGSSAIAQVEIYDDSKLAESIVPSYIKNRNLPKDQRVARKKKGEEAPAPAQPVAPKPAAEKKAQAKPEAPKPAPAKEAAKESKPVEPKADSKPAAKGPAKQESKPKA